MSKRLMFVTDPDPFDADDWRFLARSARVLDAAPDLDSAVRSAVALAVPYLAESSILCLVGTSGEMQWRAAAQADPSRICLLESLRAFPPDPTAPNPFSLAMRSGLPQPIALGGDADFVRVAGSDARHLAVLRALGPTHGHALPLATMSGVIGLMVLASPRPADARKCAVRLEFTGTLAVTLARHLARTSELRRLQEMPEVMAILSHDLKDPLAVVLAAVDCAVEERPAESWRTQTRGVRALSAARNAANRMQRLIDQVLELAKAGDDPLRVVASDVDTKQVLADLAGEFEPLAEARGVVLVVDASDDLPPVRADADRLMQALVNIVGNALKFTPRGGHVELRARCVGARVVVTVTDDGPGIGRDAHDLVFRPFWHGGVEQAGNGMGLAIARRIVEAHAGELRVESEPGHGAAFIASIPVATLRPPTEGPVGIGGAVVDAAPAGAR